MINILEHNINTKKKLYIVYILFIMATRATNSNSWQVWADFHQNICKNNEVYRVLVTKKQVLDNPEFGFLQYVKSTEESQYPALDINGKKDKFLEEQKIFEEDVDSRGDPKLVELGDYSFRVFKSSGKDGVHLKEMAQYLRNTFNWFLVLDCEEYQHQDMMYRIGDKFKRKQDDIIEPDTLFKIGEKIDCRNIGAIKSPMGQCLLQSTIDFTKRHIKLYQRAALEYITNSKENNYLRILSFNLSNFKKPVFNEERIRRTKYNVEITEEAYNPFGEDIVPDNIMNQIHTIVSANADIICLQQASESIEYRESVNDYFSIGASAYLGMIFRNASANKERLSKNQVEELCAYNLGMLAFQYAWRMREIEYLFKKTTLVFLISWLLEAHGQPTKENDPGNYSPRLDNDLGNPHDTNEYIPVIFNEWESEFESELKLHKLEARELYSYREMILDNSSYLITDRPEIIHAVLEVEKEENGRINLRNEFLKQNTPLNIYYNKRFTHPIPTNHFTEPSVYERAKMLIEQMADTYVRAPGQYDSVFGKDEFSQNEIKVWDEQKTLYEMAVEARKNRDINRILISTPNRRTLRTVYNNTADNDKIYNDEINSKPVLIRTMLENTLKKERVPRFEKSRTLTNAKFLENYDLEKSNIKVKYKIQKIKSNRYDKTVEDLSFKSTKWAQEECYRIINMHNGIRQKNYKSPDELLKHYRKNHADARNDEHPLRFAHVGIIRDLLTPAKGTEMAAKGFRQDSDILRPTIWNYIPEDENNKDITNKIFKKENNGAFQFSASMQPKIDTDRIVKKIYTNISQPDYTIEFELFKPIWKALILAIGSTENDITKFDKEVQSDIEKIRNGIKNNTRTTLQKLYENIVNNWIGEDNQALENLPPHPLPQKLTKFVEIQKQAQDFSYRGINGDLWSGIFRLVDEYKDNTNDYDDERTANPNNSYVRSSQKHLQVGGDGLEIHESIGSRGDDYWDWVRRNVMYNFKNRFTPIPETFRSSDQNQNVSYPPMIMKKYGIYLIQRLIDPEEKSNEKFNKHYLEMFDNILGKFYKDTVIANREDNARQINALNINPMLNNIINRQMYEDTFNDIINEVAHYTAKLNKRVTDMREYLTDYVVSQRNWLKYYLKSYGYTRHSTTETGLQLWHKQEIKRDNDTIVKLNFDKGVEKPTAIRIISNDGKNILVGQKTALKIGGKSNIGTFPMNIINVDMQYFDENDLNKLQNKLTRLGLDKDFTLMVGTFPIDHSLSGEDKNMTDKMKRFLTGASDKKDKYIVDTFQHFEQHNHEDPIKSTDDSKYNNIKSKLPKVTDLLSNSFDPVSNYHYQTYQNLSQKEEFGLTLKGSYVLYNTSSRHMGIISDYYIGSEIRSAQSRKLVVKEGGKKKVKTVSKKKVVKEGGKKKVKTVSKKKAIRKHRGIIQIGGKVGKLRKGFKYSGKRLKNGLPQIIKVKTNKN